MKKFIIIIIISFAFIQNSNAQDSQKIKFSIALPDTTIRHGMKDIPIQMRLKNLSSDTINVTNPSHWANAIAFIRHNGKNIPLIKVKAILVHDDDIIRLKPGQVFTTKFDYKLDELKSLESLEAGPYEIYFILYDKPKLKSNVFTFYIE